MVCKGMKMDVPCHICTATLIRVGIQGCHSLLQPVQQLTANSFLQISPRLAAAAMFLDDGGICWFVNRLAALH